MSTAVATPDAKNTHGAAQSRPLLKWVSLALALIGLADAIYLTYSHVAGVETACPTGSAIFNCDLVQHSIYSTLAGIPIVFPGLLGYIAVVAVLLLDGRIPFFTQRGPLLAFGLTLIGFLFSGYLTAIEAFVLFAWCMWCMISATVMTILFVLSAVRVWRHIGMVSEDDEELEVESV